MKQQNSISNNLMSTSGTRGNQM